jgi:hypothetical protein
VAYGSLGCGGQVTAEGGTGGAPPLGATGGTLSQSRPGGAGPRDSGPTDAPLPIDVGPIPPSACGMSFHLVSAPTPCIYLVPLPDGTFADPSKANVVYQAGDGGTYLVRMNSAAICDEGWRFTNAPTQIEICTTTCDLVRNDPGAELTILFGCIGPPPPVPVV